MLHNDDIILQFPVSAELVIFTKANKHKKKNSDEQIIPLKYVSQLCFKLCKIKKQSITVISLRTIV